MDEPIDETFVVTPTDVLTVDLAPTGAPGENPTRQSAAATIGSPQSLGGQVLFLQETEAGANDVAIFTAGEALLPNVLSADDPEVIARGSLALVAGDEPVALWAELTSAGSARIVAKVVDAEAAPQTLLTIPDRAALPRFAAAAREGQVGVARVLEGETPAVELTMFGTGDFAELGSTIVAQNERIATNVAMGWATEAGVVIWEELEASGVRRLQSRLVALHDDGPDAERAIVPLTRPGERGEQPRVVTHLGGFGVTYLSRPFSSTETSRTVVVGFVSGSTGVVEERLEIASVSNTASPVAAAIDAAGVLVAAWYDVQISETPTSTLKTTSVFCPDLWLLCSPPS